MEGGKKWVEKWKVFLNKDHECDVLYIMHSITLVLTRYLYGLPTRAGGPHRKNEPLQRTARPFNALRATVRPRRRLPCTLACHYQVTSAQSKPAPAAVAATRAWQLE